MRGPHEGAHREFETRGGPGQLCALGIHGWLKCRMDHSLAGWDQVGATGLVHQAGVLVTGPGRAALPGSLPGTKSWELRTRGEQRYWPGAEHW